MKLSVIIPVYNSGLLLKKCISSIENQSFKDFEVICIDDKSDDDETIAVLSSLPRNIKVIHLELHLGAANARNTGLRIASGEYVIFLDSDDTIEHDCFEKMISLIELKSSDLCVCGHRRIDIHGYTIEKMPRILDFCDYIERITHLEENAFELFPISTWAYMIKRELLIMHNIDFQTLSLNNDVYFILAILIKSDGISIYHEKPLINHVVGLSNQITSSYDLWTIPLAFTYFMLREDVKENSSLYYQLLYLWINSVPEGIKRCDNYYMALQTYLYLSKLLIKNSNFAPYKSKRINHILDMIRNNPYSIDWIINE